MRYEMAEPQEDTEIANQRRIRKAAFWFAIAAVFGAALVFASALTVLYQQPFSKWEPMVHKHFDAIVGLPAAAAVAFVLVVFLRQAEGPIEFEAWGLKVKGAAGQVIMWVLCFLSIVFAIKWLWGFGDT
jgi:hypothetical protein